MVKVKFPSKAEHIAIERILFIRFQRFLYLFQIRFIDLILPHLAPFPLVVHDSMLLKQIQDSALEKLLVLYNRSPKQVFIAMDKGTSYMEKSQQLLQSSYIQAMVNSLVFLGIKLRIPHRNDKPTDLIKAYFLITSF